MAIDRWMLQQVCQGRSPLLRFYTWSTPTLSLGYHQRHIPDHWSCLTVGDRPVTIVRRPTGGRAVLHGAGELTYAITTQTPHRQRTATYRWLCEFLIQAWAEIGIPLQLGEQVGEQVSEQGYADRQRQSCFSTATPADLVTRTGAKLIGSAQLYHQHFVLQHGSMQLAPDVQLWERVFGDRPQPVQLPQISQAQLIQMLQTAARSHFQTELKVYPLQPQEWAEVEVIKQQQQAARS